MRLAFGVPGSRIGSVVSGVSSNETQRGLFAPQ